MTYPNPSSENKDPRHNRGDDPKEDKKNILGQTEDALENLRKIFTANTDKSEKESIQFRKDSTLFSAIRRRDVTRVQKCLDEGASPNAYSKIGETALHICAHIGADNIAKILIERGADPLLGTTDDPEKLPILDAVKFGKPAMVKLLTRMGGYAPNKTSIDGKTLLHMACEKGKTDMARAFIEAGANPNSPTPNGTTPLLMALHYAQIETVLYLLTLPDVVAQMNTLYTKTDPLKNTAFQKAIDMGVPDIIDRMIETGAHINAADAQHQTPLAHAVQQKNLSLTKTLIKAGADINKVPDQKYHPLIMACENNHPEIIPDDRPSIIDVLLKKGADIDVVNPVNGHSPLHYILKTEEDISTLKKILSYPLNTEIHDSTGATPLFYVLQTHATEKLSLLLEKGANPNARHGYDARTPLIDAVQNNNVAAVKMLLDADADPLLCDAENRSAVFYADQIKSKEMTSILQNVILKDYTALQPRTKISNLNKRKNNLRPKP